MMYNYPFYFSQNYQKFHKYNNPLKAQSKTLNSQLSNNSDNKNLISKTLNEKDAYGENQPIFELFGIKLYFDDILLICLIFFLYNEGVKDDYLFISLILLLLS